MWEHKIQDTSHPAKKKTQKTVKVTLSWRILSTKHQEFLLLNLWQTCFCRLSGQLWGENQWEANIKKSLHIVQKYIAYYMCIYIYYVLQLSVNQYRFMNIQLPNHSKWSNISFESPPVSATNNYIKSNQMKHGESKEPWCKSQGYDLGTLFKLERQSNVIVVEAIEWFEWNIKLGKKKQKKHTIVLIQQILFEGYSCSLLLS